VNETLLLDNSAWARLTHPALSDERVAEVSDAFEAGRVATCLPFLLEAGYSARNARDHDELLAFRSCRSTSESSLGVLHHNRDYDLTTEKTDLDFMSVWLAPAGSL
jgi:hypothetical protein